MCPLRLTSTEGSLSKRSFQLLAKDPSGYESAFILSRSAALARPELVLA